jgi:hypothetical protein
MAMSTFIGGPLAFLRRFPALHRALRSAYISVHLTAVKILRFAIPRHFLFGPPKGCFSALELVRNGKIPGRIILKNQTVGEFGSNTLVKLSKFGQDEYQPWPVFWSLHQNIRLVGPSLAHLNSRKEGCIEAMFGQPFASDDASYNYVAHTKPVRLDGNWTSIFSNWCRNEACAYWHYLMDGLARLALLDEFPADTKILVPSKLEPWKRELLDLLGLAGRYRPTNERHLLVGNYYFSSMSAMTGCYNPFAVEFLRSRLLLKSDRNFKGPRKFYILREGWKQRVTNEDEVRRFFQDKGWALIAPETLGMAAEIELFRNAEAVCGVHGSGFANLLWASPGCRVLELCPSNLLSGAFECVAKILNLDHSFLICEGDAWCRATVDIKALASKLEL